jgi:hypothetical protein
VAHCYRHAGSKVVQRGWAAVRFLGFLTGMKIVSYADADAGRHRLLHLRPHRHPARKIGAGMIETVEGNTGRAGAVSDSRTGGDGVYIKQPRHQRARRPLRPRHPLGRNLVSKTIGISPKVYVPAIGQIVGRDRVPASSASTSRARPPSRPASARRGRLQARRPRRSSPSAPRTRWTRT